MYASNLEQTTPQFLADHEEHVEAVLLDKKISQKDMSDEICLKRTKVCKGVDETAKVKKQTSIMMDGKPITPNKDGSIEL